MQGEICTITSKIKKSLPKSESAKAEKDKKLVEKEVLVIIV